MKGGMAQCEIQAVLQRLIARAESPRALTVRSEERAALLRAVERAEAQLLGETDSVLTIALAGCSGAGKSTLINALAGSTIAAVSEQRPCTMQTKVYHHHEVPGGGLPQELAAQAVFAAHDRPELRYKVIVDTPDLDTFATQNRAATKALLKAAGLVIYVFSPERYAEERAWSVIREERRFSACIAIVNKADTVPPHVLERIADEIRRRFADMGESNMKVLRVCAASHVPGPDGKLPTLAPAVMDEFASLRAYIEHELNAGDIARMQREQRARVIDNLRVEVERLVPQDAVACLDALAAAAAERASAAGGKLSDDLADRLAAIEADLAPLATLRKHQRFWGPFRTWLAVADFFRYGLPRLVRRLRYASSGDEQGVGVATILAAGKTDLADDLIRSEARKLQDLCFKGNLPVERWRTGTAGASGVGLLSQAAAEIEARYEALAAAAFGRSKPCIWGASLMGALVPAGLVVFGLVELVRDMASGQYTGFAVLGQTLALLFFFNLVLHSVVALILASGEAFAMRGVGSRTVHDVVKRTLEGWVGAYRADLEADLTDLREPLDALQTTLTAAPINIPNSPASWTARVVVTPPPAVQMPVSSMPRLTPSTLALSAERVAYLEPKALVSYATSAEKSQPMIETDLPTENKPEPTVPNAAERLRQAMQRYTAQQQA